MKRFDRATYLLFLLVLLADVAGAHASAPAGGDASGGLILRAAGQLQVGPAGGSVRRAGGSSSRTAGFKGYRLGASAWAGNLFHPSSHLTQPSPVLLTEPAFAIEAESGSSIRAMDLLSVPSGRIFEHSGSPAP